MRFPEMDYTSVDIIHGISQRDSKIIHFIYKSCYKDVRKLILHNAGREEDVKDIFQEALLIIYKKIVQQGLKLNSTFQTYIYSVCRFLWLKELEARRKNQIDYESSDNIQLAGSHNNETEETKLKLYERHFYELSQHCQKVLYMYFQNATMMEICKEMGYRTIQIAKDKKYRCKKSLVNKIQNNPEFKKLNDEVHLVS